MSAIIPIKSQGSAPSVGTPDYRHMELIVKPTEACNFKCTFCSSTSISSDNASVLPLNYIFDFLKRFPNTQTIIVNGGDPLMVKPQYYWDIIKFLDENNLRTTLSLTTNLWAFYKKPSMWKDLFQHSRVGVTTSFNYGNTRRVTNTQVYTEELFWKVSDKFEQLIGYRPDFISVITEENEDSAINNVKLAQRMNVECKLNYAMASGDQGSPYQLSKIYQMYVEIYELGLWHWEYNTKQMMQRLTLKANSCPQSRQCDEGIRCIQPDGDYYSCGSFGDDKQYSIDFNSEIYHGTFTTPLQVSHELLSLKPECFTCDMFAICNGCKKTISDMKIAGIVENHCTLMKTLEPKIIKINDLSSHIHVDLLPKLGPNKFVNV